MQLTDQTRIIVIKPCYHFEMFGVLRSTVTLMLFIRVCSAMDHSGVSSRN